MSEETTWADVREAAQETDLWTRCQELAAEVAALKARVAELEADRERREAPIQLD